MPGALAKAKASKAQGVDSVDSVDGKGLLAAQHGRSGPHMAFLYID